MRVATVSAETTASVGGSGGAGGRIGARSVQPTRLLSPSLVSRVSPLPSEPTTQIWTGSPLLRPAKMIWRASGDHESASMQQTPVRRSRRSTRPSTPSTATSSPEPPIVTARLFPSGDQASALPSPRMRCKPVPFGRTSRTIEPSSLLNR